VAAVATLAIGERLPLLPAIGVLLIGGAVAVLGLTPWRRVRTNRPAVVAAVLTGFAIAGYTLLDGVGVRRSGSPVGYTLWLMGLHGLVTAVVVSLIRRRRGTPVPAAVATTRSWLVAGLAGVMSLLAYGLVLWAQSRGALAAVAALRESSVVVAAVIGAVFFAEPVGRVRIAASVAIAVGVVLLAVTA
jgi:drug/metabolite transporter (DMT)-like permease